MSHRFLAYLNEEHTRLKRVKATLKANGQADGPQMAHLQMLTQAVERQMEQWASDLLPRREAV